jgi:NAD-dependent DNA ligase
MSDYDSLYFRKYTRKAEFDKAIHILEGILKGIAIDEIINQKEVNELKTWYNHYMWLINKHPFSELMPVITKTLADNILDSEELEDLLWLCNNLKTNNIYFNVITSDIQRLQGILHGIMSDNVISKDELDGLHNWLEDNNHLAGVYPYDEIYSILTAVLADGVLSDDEKKLLKVLFGDFIDLNVSVNINIEEISKLKQEINIEGICAVCPEISFPGKVFCFTGMSSKTTRNTIKDTIESNDGIFSDSVTKQTDYLVVGNNGNPCWAFACYGRKIEAAVKLRKNGHRVLIVHENDFWDSLEDYVASKR